MYRITPAIAATNGTYCKRDSIVIFVGLVVEDAGAELPAPLTRLLFAGSGGTVGKLRQTVAERGTVIGHELVNQSPSPIHPTPAERGFPSDDEAGK